MGALVGAGARTWRVATTRIQMFTTTRRPSGGVRRERNPAPIRIIMGNNDTSGDLGTLLGMSACRRVLGPRRQAAACLFWLGFCAC